MKQRNQEMPWTRHRSQPRIQYKLPNRPIRPRPSSRPYRVRFITNTLIDTAAEPYYILLLIASNCAAGALLIATVCLLRWRYKRQLAKAQVSPQAGDHAVRQLSNTSEAAGSRRAEGRCRSSRVTEQTPTHELPVKHLMAEAFHTNIPRLLLVSMCVRCVCSRAVCA